MAMVEVVLSLAPLVLLAGLLLLGCFPGERAILARRPAAPAPRLRPAARRWRPAVERAPTSELERTSHRRRGPPAFA
jgi:hypothetical protein